MKNFLLLLGMVVCVINAHSQTANYNIVLDYDNLDDAYSLQNGDTYSYYYWDLNKRYPNSTFSLDYATTFYDTLLFLQNGNLTFVPASKTTLKLDSFDVPFIHNNNTGNYDTIRFTVYNMAQKVYTNYGAPNSTLTTPTVWDTLIIVNTSITPSGPNVTSKRMYPNLQFSQGQTFGIRIDFSGDTANHFQVASGYRDECNGACYAMPAFAGNRTGYYLNLTTGTGLNLSGYFENAGTGGNIFYDCNASSNYTAAACEDFPVQNIVMTAYVNGVVSYGANITASTLTGCPGTSVALTANTYGSTATPFTYAWSTSSGTLTSGSGQQTSLILGSSNATVTVTVTVTDANNQTTTATITAQSKAINIVFSNANPASLNCGSSINLITTTTGNVTGKQYSWSTGQSGANATVINVGQSGTYSVTVTNNSGCSASASIAVQYPGNLTNTISFTPPPSPICAGMPETFVNTSSRQTGWNYNWTFGDGNISFTQTGVNTYGAAGVYSVQLKQDSAGCQFSSPVQSITVLPASNPACQQSGTFAVSLGQNQTVCIGQNVSIMAALSGQSTAPYTYVWQQTGSALNCNNCNNPGAVINQNSTYIVVVTDNNGSVARDTIVFTAVSCGGSNACGTSGSSICTPSGTLTQPGFSPASQNLPPFVNGQVSTTVVQFKNFDTFVFSGQTVTVVSLKFDTISNLPTGLCWASNKANNTYANQEDGCIAFVGTPCATPGQYKLYMVVTANIGVPIQTNADAAGLKYFVRVENAGDADVAVDTNQTVLFVAYGNASSCTTSTNNPTVSLGSNQAVCTGTTVTLQPAVTGGTAPYSYQWQSTGNALSCSNCTSPTATITQNSTYTVTVTDNNNKTASATVSYTLSATGTVQISANGPTTFCQGGNVTLSASGYSTYTWSTGSNLSAINVTQNGTYTLTVTNGTGCSSTGSINVNVSAPPTTPNIVGSTSINPSQSYTYAVNQTSGVTYSWTVQGGAIQSGQGTNSVSVVWGSSGPYSISVVASQGGCITTATLNVISSSCSLGINVNTVSSTPLCTGDTALLIAQVSGTATYVWFKNGAAINNQTDDTLRVVADGSYQVQVTSAGCTVLSSAIGMSFLQSPLQPVITGGSGSGNCTAQAVTLNVTGSYTGYQWNSGQTTSSITVTASGSYIVTVSANNGCTSASSPFLLNQSVVQQPGICIVSVDSITNKNIVVWEKTNTSQVDSYFIYKEGVQFNVFNKIGGIGPNDFSTFVDLASTPQQQADRYKIAILDTCGIVSLQSDAHKTIHLTINQGLGASWNLIWNHYEGFAYPSYSIYRGTSAGSLQQITTISSGNNSYTDLTPPAGVVYYQIEIQNPAGCTPTTKTESYGSARSNIAQTLPNGVMFTEAVMSMNVYPNPTEGDFVLSVNLFESKQVDVRITDLLGREMLKEKWTLQENLNTKTFSLQLSAGTYYVSVIGSGVSVTKRVTVVK